MIRKLSASGFIALLALILAFQHPVLGYCCCANEFFLADSQCTSQPVAPASCCQQICESSTEVESQKTPCSDCCQKFSCELGDLFWAPSGEPETFSGSELISLDPLGHFSRSLASASTFFIASPDPPPDSGPLFLRLGVMLL